MKPKIYHGDYPNGPIVGEEGIMARATLPLVTTIGKLNVSCYGTDVAFMLRLCCVYVVYFRLFPLISAYFHFEKGNVARAKL